MTFFGPAGRQAGRLDVRDNVRIAFSAPITRGTGAITLRRADGAIEETFDAATSAALTIDGQTLIVNPTWDLQGSYSYSITFASGAVAYASGGSWSGVADVSTLSFSTDLEIRDVTGATNIRDQYPGSDGVESIGNHRALYIPVTFANDNRLPTSLESMQWDDILPTVTFFAENSQNAMTFSADYTPMVTLPYTYAWHQQFDAQYNGLGLLMSQSQAIARQMGFDSSNYEVTILRFSDVDLRAGASWGGGNSVWLGWGGFGVTAHETGHALGLPHPDSVSWTGNVAGGLNSLDIMGGGGAANSDVILDRKMNLGWVEAGSRLLNAGPGVYRIHGQDQVNRVAGQYYGLTQQIAADVLGANPQYTIEYRPSITELGPSVVLLRNLSLVDLTPATSSKFDAGLQMGQSVRVPGSDAYFTVIDVRDGYAELAYQLGPFPDNVAPTASLAATATTVATGGSVAFTANAVDANGDALVYYWEFSDGVKGVGASFSRTFTQTTATAITGTLTVADMRGGTATRTITINAGATSTGTPQTVGSVTNPSLSKPRVAVTASDGFAAEGGDTGVFTFTRLGTSTTAALTVNFTFSGATSDFASLPSSVVIPAGQSQATVTLSAVDDAVIEAVKRLVVTVSSATAYDISSQNTSATLTVGDNDTPTVTIEAINGVAAEGSRDSGLLLIRRTGPTTEPLTVYYGLSGDAFNGGDYGRLDGQIVIPAGEAAVALSVAAIDDEVGEPDELATVFLTAFNGTYSVGATSTASVTIKDNADPPVVSVRLAEGMSRIEGSTQRVYFDVSGGDGQPRDVRYTIGGTATSDADYKPLSGTFRVPTGGRQSVWLDVATLADSVNEHAETISLTLAPSFDYVIGEYPTALVEIVEPIDESTGGDRVNV
ncbi:MAG: Calx-beta domain-containing protein, partial [Planctomycetota bacterium]